MSLRTVMGSVPVPGICGGICDCPWDLWLAVPEICDVIAMIDKVTLQLSEDATDFQIFDH